MQGWFYFSPGFENGIGSRLGLWAQRVIEWRKIAGQPSQHIWNKCLLLMRLALCLYSVRVALPVEWWTKKLGDVVFRFLFLNHGRSSAVWLRAWNGFLGSPPYCSLAMVSSCVATYIILSQWGFTALRRVWCCSCVQPLEGSLAPFLSATIFELCRFPTCPETWSVCAH